LINLIHFPFSTGLGVDLFDHDAVETRVLPVWNGHQRMLTLATPKRVYHAVYRAAEPPETQTPREMLIDPVRDPGGLHDLASREPLVLARFHELARIYVTVYPWLIVHGNSSMPPSALQPRAVGATHAAAMAR